MSEIKTITHDVGGTLEHDGDLVINGNILPGASVIVRNGCLLVNGEAGDHVSIRQSNAHAVPDRDLSGADWWRAAERPNASHEDNAAFATRMTEKKTAATLLLCGVRLNGRAGAGLNLETGNDAVLAQAGADSRLSVGGNLAAGALGERAEVNVSGNAWIDRIGAHSHAYSGSEMRIGDVGEGCSLEAALSITGVTARDGVSAAAGNGIRFRSVGHGADFTATYDIVCGDSGNECIFNSQSDLYLRHTGERCQLTGESLKALSLGAYTSADMEDSARIESAIGEHAHVRADHVTAGALLPHAIVNADDSAVFGDIHAAATVIAASIEAKRILGGTLRARSGPVRAMSIALETTLVLCGCILTGHTARLGCMTGETHAERLARPPSHSLLPAWHGDMTRHCHRKERRDAKIEGNSSDQPQQLAQGVDSRGQ